MIQAMIDDPNINIMNLLMIKNCTTDLIPDEDQT